MQHLPELFINSKISISGVKHLLELVINTKTRISGVQHLIKLSINTKTTTSTSDIDMHLLELVINTEITWRPSEATCRDCGWVQAPIMCRLCGPVDVSNPVTSILVHEIKPIKMPL